MSSSAFESPYGGQFTLSTQLIKPNILHVKSVCSELLPAPKTFHFLVFRKYAFTCSRLNFRHYLESGLRSLSVLSTETIHKLRIEDKFVSGTEWDVSVSKAGKVMTAAKTFFCISTTGNECHNVTTGKNLQYWGITTTPPCFNNEKMACFGFRAVWVYHWFLIRRWGEGERGRGERGGFIFFILTKIVVWRMRHS